MDLKIAFRRPVVANPSPNVLKLIGKACLPITLHVYVDKWRESTEKTLYYSDSQRIELETITPKEGYSWTHDPIVIRSPVTVSGE